MHRLRFFVSACALLVVAGCDGGLGPLPWAATPDTLTIFSVSRVELLGKPSAFDISTQAVRVRLVVVESAAEAGTWDVALAEQDGRFVMLPVSIIPGLDARAGIATMTETTLEEVREAPGDTARYVRGAAVPIEVGTVYVIRGRRETSCGGLVGAGPRYAKLKALALDEATGSFRFEIVRNPFCNDRDLIPPED